MVMRALRPVQLVCVPDKVRTKVSQVTPSTQVLSSSEPPPAAVPTQFTVGPVGLSVPELGVAERNAVAKNANTTRKTPITKKSALIVVRAVIEEEIFVRLKNRENGQMWSPHIGCPRYKIHDSALYDCGVNRPKSGNRAKRCLSEDPAPAAYSAVPKRRRVCLSDGLIVLLQSR